MLNIELKDTIVPMCSADYRDRFVAEYIQLRIRWERLKGFNTRIKAAVLSFGEEHEVEMPKHDCPDELLREQQRIMGELLHVLEVRAVIEGIDLSGCMKMLSDKAREREEERKDMTPLSECTSDAQIVTEAIARCMHLDVTCDEEEDLLFGAAVNVISKLRGLEEPCKACDTEEVDLQDDTSSVSQSEPPSPAGEGLEEERPEGLMSLEETIKIVEYCSRRACDSCPLYYSDCMTPKSESALYYLKKYAESRRLQMSAGVS